MAQRTPVESIVRRKSVPPLWVVRAVMALRSALQRLADSLVPADVLVVEHAGVLGKPILMALVTELGIPDLISQRGPLTAEEMAPAVGVLPDMLHRALRYLCSFGVFSVDREGRFSNTRISRQMTRNAVMHNAVALLGSELNVKLWGDVHSTLKTGVNSFERNLGPIWEWFDAHAEDGERFVHGMASMTAMEAPFLAASYAYDQFRTICDVGGGSGVLLASILSRYPTLRAILFDHPSVLPHSRAYLGDAGVLDRTDLVEGDFFEAVPPGADAYMLKDILHDWDDERCSRILGAIRDASGKGTRLLVHETLVERDIVGPPAIMDVQMAVATGGRNRSLEELKSLLSKAGFELRKVIRLPSPTSTLETLAV